jgi:putative peptide zinc metalloprotease protein
LISDQGQIAVAYLNEDEINRISKGDLATFYSDGLGGPIVSLEVINIDPDASRTLSEPELANLFGGNIVVREKNNQFYPERPIYRVTLKVISSTQADSLHTWRGKIVISGRWASPGWRYIRSAMALARREAGF